MESYLYAGLLLFTLLGPLSRSFEPRIQYYKSFPRLLIATTIVAIPFLIWDHIFTSKSYWGFNARYITGIKLGVLPIEEVSYFFIIPFACVFIYELVKYFSKWKFKYTVHTSFILVTTLLTIGFLNLDKAYTSITFIALSVALTALTLIQKETLGTFYISFIFVLVPFYVINGILTGSFIAEEVVWYNNNENLNFRILTIPVEDHFYGMLQLVLTVSIYEKLRIIQS